MIRLAPCQGDVFRKQYIIPDTKEPGRIGQLLQCAPLKWIGVLHFIHQDIGKQTHEPFQDLFISRGRVEKNSKDIIKIDIIPFPFSLLVTREDLLKDFNGLFIMLGKPDRVPKTKKSQASPV